MNHYIDHGGFFTVGGDFLSKTFSRIFVQANVSIDFHHLKFFSTGALTESDET